MPASRIRSMDNHSSQIYRFGNVSPTAITFFYIKSQYSLIVSMIESDILTCKSIITLLIFKVKLSCSSAVAKDIKFAHAGPNKIPKATAMAILDIINIKDMECSDLSFYIRASERHSLSLRKDEHRPNTKMNPPRKAAIIKRSIIRGGDDYKMYIYNGDVEKEIYSQECKKSMNR